MKDSNMLMTTSADGTRIGYWKSGSGPPLLMVHGTTADHNSWFKISPYLEQHFTIYTMDRRGRGGSDDSSNYDFMREAEDIVAVVKSIGDNVAVFGHSFGGLCSLEAALHTDGISKLILYEPPLPGIVPVNRDALDRVQVLADKGDLERALEVFYREIVKMPDQELTAFHQSPVWQERVKNVPTISREMHAEDTYDFKPGKFDKFQTPTMLLLGGDSPPFARQVADILHSALPNSNLVVLSGQQHMAHYEEPRLLTEKMKNFLLDDTLKMPAKVSGEGTPLVLVPGGLTGWNSWEPFVEIFSAQQKQVIRMQLLNVQYGIENRNLPSGYSVKIESQALTATLDSLGLREPLDMVAWSYGALVTLDYALDHPDRIRTLTLIEPPAFWVLREEGTIDSETQHTLDFLKTMRGDITEDMLASFLREAGLVPKGHQAEELPQWDRWLPFRQSLRSTSAIITHTDSLNRLKRLKAPVLFIKGIGSGEYYHRIVDILVAQLPHATSIELQGGHASHIVSRDQFLTELDHFQKNKD